jgi:hypothetical protein
LLRVLGMTKNVRIKDLDFNNWIGFASLSK